MTGVLDRLGRTASRRPLRVIAGWLVVAGTVVVLAAASTGHTFDDFTIPSPTGAAAAKVDIA